MPNSRLESRNSQSGFSQNKQSRQDVKKGWETMFPDLLSRLSISVQVSASVSVTDLAISITLA
jgi:hypothetical protein